MLGFLARPYRAGRYPAVVVLHGCGGDLVVYPAVVHAFDFNEPPRRYLGHLMRFDPAASHDAERRVRAFLQQTIGGPPAQR